MYPIYDIEGINSCEREIEEKHVIILLFVKPGDKNADEILNLVNYLHYKSDGYCAIYLIGYSQDFMNKYRDVKNIDGVDGEKWQYSDNCFISVCKQLQTRLKNWKYSGEPEMILLQNTTERQTSDRLDFRGYNYIDINYGIKKGYIDSFARFMERVIDACREEVNATNAIKKANRSRINCRNVIEMAIEETPKLPNGIKKILKDTVFYKSCRNNTDKEKNIFHSNPFGYR